MSEDPTSPWGYEPTNLEGALGIMSQDGRRIAAQIEMAHGSLMAMSEEERQKIISQRLATHMVRPLSELLRQGDFDFKMPEDNPHRPYEVHRATGYILTLGEETFLRRALSHELNKQRAKGR